MNNYSIPDSIIHPAYNDPERPGSHRVFRFDYEKPKIVKLSKMRFPLDIIEKQGQGVVCKQCSSCHNCR